MKALALARVDLSVVSSVLTACLVVIALGTSSAVMRFVRLLVETVWLYLSNARG